jgi:hypothetical protein
VVRYAAAALAEAGVDPEKLARLTDRQIHLIYGHPREAKTGKLREPGAAPDPRRFETVSPAGKLRHAARVTGMDPAELARALAQLEARDGPGDPG